ncbi:MAG: purine/pyrimidine permease [Desulfarculus sp.]|nr:purine/pyrimidine permease [Desulfarculus sp.]
MPQPDFHELKLRYSLDAWPPPLATGLLALQWLVVLLPGLLVLGEVVVAARGLDPAQRVGFLQRLLLLGGLVQLAQVFLGHRLPGLVGPATVLMVGMLATLGSGQAAVFGALALGGVLTALMGALGLARRLGRLYTPPVLAATLLLISISLGPTLRDLLFDPHTAGRSFGGSFLYALGLAALLFWGQSRIKGLLGSALLLFGLVLGSAVYHLLGLGPWPGLGQGAGAGLDLANLLPMPLALDWGVLASFCLCYLALIANELASVEALGPMVGLGEMGRRPDRAVLVSGLGGVLAGLWGVPGPVTYSLSPGILITSQSASRLTLAPAALALMALALWPGGLAWVGLMPAPVVGAVLLALTANTVYAALLLMYSEGEKPDWADGLVVGMGLMGALVVSFMPDSARAALHPLLRPLLGNGFVMGLLLALAMEHIVLRRGKAKSGR